MKQFWMTAVLGAALIVPVGAKDKGQKPHRGGDDWARHTEDEWQRNTDRGGKHKRAGAKGGMRGLDRDGNGYISRDEWRGNDQSWSRHDRNGDGVISHDESSYWFDSQERSRRRDDRFDRRDRNQDGVITRDEWRERR